MTVTTDYIASNTIARDDALASARRLVDVADAEGRALSDAEQAQFDAHEEQATRSQARLDTYKADADRAESIRGNSKMAVLTDRNPYDRDHGTATTDIVTRARQAIDQADAADDGVRTEIDRLLRAGGDDGDRAAQWVVAASDPAYERALCKLFRDPERGHLEFNDAENLAYQRAAEAKRAVVVSTDASGGFLVPFTLDPTVILTSSGSIDPMRRIARQRMTTTDSWSGVTSAGVTAEWKSEAAEAADATPNDFANPTIPVHLADAYVEVSIEATQDTSIVGQLGELFADARANHEATAFWTGTGTGQPEGVVTGLDGTASEVTPETTETFTKADVYALLEAVPARHRGNASWVANLAVYHLIRQFDTTGGADLWTQLGAGTPAQLLGKDAYEASEADPGFDVTATADNHLLTCGNFRSGYVIADRIGATMEMIPHVMGANGRPKGVRGFFYYWRVGGKVVNPAALRMLNVATTA